NFQVQVIFANVGAAGSPGTVDICTSDPGCFSPFTGLTGNPTAGGNWIVYDTTGVIFLDYLPEWDICNNMADYVNFIANKAPNYYTGDFIFEYVLGNGSCEPDFTPVTVNIFEPVDAGIPTAITVCVTDPPFSLTGALDGTPDLGLEWE